MKMWGRWKESFFAVRKERKKRDFIDGSVLIETVRKGSQLRIQKEMTKINLNK
jgi:hypothetical protein